jgi:hypothetical protein
MVPAPPFVYLIVLFAICCAARAVWEEGERIVSEVTEHVRETTVTRERHDSGEDYARPGLRDRLTIVRAALREIRERQPDTEDRVGDPGGGVTRRLFRAGWGGARQGVQFVTRRRDSGDPVRTWIPPLPQSCGHWVNGVEQFGAPRCVVCTAQPAPAARQALPYDPADMDRVWQEHGPDAAYRRPHGHVEVCGDPASPAAVAVGETAGSPPFMIHDPASGRYYGAGETTSVTGPAEGDGRVPYGVTADGDLLESVAAPAGPAAVDPNPESAAITSGPDSTTTTEGNQMTKFMPAITGPQRGGSGGLAVFSSSTAPTHNQWRELYARIRDHLPEMAKRYQELIMARLAGVNPGDSQWLGCQEWLARFPEMHAAVEKLMADVEAVEGPIADGTNAAGGHDERCDTPYHAN